MLAFPFPYIANTLGWMTAELGRQPWLIYGLFRTSDGYSKVVSSGDTVFTLIGFVGLYFVLGVLFLVLVGREISHVLLLHLGAYSPEILPPLFDLLKARGFEFVTLEEAQRDPIYQVDPNFIDPQPGTLLEQHMDAKRLPYPPLPTKPRQEVAAICT